ncbi:glycosyltransferase family 8 protein [Sphaerisporangium sp. NPDC049003]|uniref:glycosyltransferase family 8 protein n=1 Tax=Sphaerisporangium sp. NPDC049003 TaxID=3364517 RepID=UPI0037181D47
MIVYAFGLCVNERYLMPALVTLESLARALPTADRRDAAVRVLTLDLTRQHAATMADLAARFGFGSFDLRWARPASMAVMADTAYITVTAWLRFQFTPAFIGRPYFVYVDADTLVVDDISTPLDGLPADQLGLVADEFAPTVGKGQALPGLTRDRPELAGRPYFNGGMWWASTAMLASVRRGVSNALKTGRRYIFHNDQDALNLWLLASGSVHAVPRRFNTFELARFLELSDWPRRYTPRARTPNATDAALLHFVGSAKPWLPSTPVTQHVRLYRHHLDATLRQVQQLGDLSFDAPRWRRR